MTTPQCPDTVRLTAYLVGKLSGENLQKVESHVRDCAACQVRAESLDETRDSFLSYLRGVAAMPPDNEEVKRLLAHAHDLTRTTVIFHEAGPKKKVGDYELLKELARGGLGIVYLARHPDLGLRAIKRPQLRDDHERRALLERFRREVQAVGSLRDDRVVLAHHAGADDEGPYLVTEYLDGESLSHLLTRRRILPVPESCELVRQAALGLQAAHEQRGLVHRDIKPSNLMLARSGSGKARVVVIDWGLVKLPGSGDAPADELTDVGVAMGTADYIAPEQVVDAKTVDIRADIYSLGVTFYCLLAGAPPFSRYSSSAKWLAHGQQAFPPLAQIRSDVPKGVLAVLHRMTEKDPKKRFATPAEVATALQPFACPESDLTALLANDEVTPAPVPTPPKPPRRVSRPMAAILGFLMATALLAVVLRVKTSWGQIELNFPDGIPDKADFLVDGDLVAIHRLDDHKGEITVRAGAHGIAVRAGDKEYKSPDKVVVERSGKALLTVKFEKAKAVDAGLFKKLGKIPEKQAVLGEGPDEPVSMVGHRGRCTALVFTPDGRQAISESVGFVCVWDLEKRRRLHEWDIPHNGYTIGPGLVAISPDGASVAVAVVPAFGSRRNLLLLERKSGKQVGVLRCEDTFDALAFSPDNSLLATAENGPKKGVRVHVSEIRTEKQRNEFPSGANAVNDLAFSPDGKYLLTGGSEGVLRLWSLEHDRQERTYEGHAGAVNRVAFSSDGKSIFSASHLDGTLRVWDAATGKERQQVPAGKAEKRINCIAFWPGGRALTGHADGTLMLWDLATGKKQKQFKYNGFQITAAAISPDGRHALSAVSTGTVHLVYLFRLPP